MHVDDPEQIEGKELVYDLNMENSNGNESADGRTNELERSAEGSETSEAKTEYSCGRQVPSGTISVDGKPFDQRDLPGIIGHALSGETLAGDCDGINVAGIGDQKPQGEEVGFDRAFGEVVSESENETTAAGGPPSAIGGESGQLKEDDYGQREESKEVEESERERRTSSGRTYFQGKKRSLHSRRGRGRARRFS